MAKKQYDALSATNQELTKKLGDSEAQMADCKTDNDSLREQAVLLEQKNQGLRNTAKMLAQKNRHLSQQVLNIQDDKIAVQKTLAAREKALEYASKTYDDLVGSLRQEVEEGKVTIQEMQDQLKVSMVERIMFPAGTVELTDSGRKVLAKVATILKKVTDKRIQVEGHSDNSPVAPNMQASYPSNWEISARRATSVVRYLIEKGVKPRYLAAVGLSHFHPIADNTTPEGRQRNRRIEIILSPLPKDSES